MEDISQPYTFVSDGHTKLSKTEQEQVMKMNWADALLFDRWNTSLWQQIKHVEIAFESELVSVKNRRKNNAERCGAIFDDKVRYLRPEIIHLLPTRFLFHYIYWGGFTSQVCSSIQMP